MKLFLLAGLFFWSCSHHTEPNWIDNYPKIEGYWYGIGSIDKPFSGTDIRGASRSQALSEISSQIYINIESSLNMVVIEDNFKLNEFTKSIISTQVENNLSSIEIIDSYENDNRYYVLARLSKKKYFEDLDKKRKNAIEACIELINQAEKNFNSRSFNLLNSAMNEIAPYINHPIEEEYPKGSGNNINLYSYIKNLAFEYMNRVQLILPNDIIEYTFGSSEEYNLELNILDKNNNIPISNIPIIFYINESEKRPFVLSDIDGNCIFSLPDVKFEKSMYHINYELDIKQLFNHPFFNNNFNQLKVQSILKIIPPKISFIITENKLGIPVSNSYVEPAIVNYFSNNFAAEFINKGDPDLIINAMINTRSVSKTPNQYGIFQVFGDITISISSASSGALLLKKSFNKVQGSDFNSNEEAANQSLMKIKELVTSDFLPQVIDAINID